MLGSDLLQRGGPPSSTGTSSFSSMWGGSSGPRNQDLETGCVQGPEHTQKTWGEMRRRGEDTPDKPRTSPGPLQGFGPERVKKDGKCFFIFLKIFIFN